MKIGGKTLRKETGEFTILRRQGDEVERWVVPIQSVGPDFEAQIEAALPKPRPPVDYARDRSNAIIKDKDGKPQRIVDENDPKYQARLQEWEGLRLVAYVWAGTRPGAITLEETAADLEANNPEAFYRSLLRELSVGGVSQGELVAWFVSIRELSMPKPEEVKEAEKSFPAS